MHVYVEGEDDWHISDTDFEELLCDALKLPSYDDQQEEIFNLLHWYLSDVDTTDRVTILDDDDEVLWVGEL